MIKCQLVIWLEKKDRFQKGLEDEQMEEKCNERWQRQIVRQ